MKNLYPGDYRAFCSILALSSYFRYPTAGMAPAKAGAAAACVAACAAVLREVKNSSPKMRTSSGSGTSGRSASHLPHFSFLANTWSEQLTHTQSPGRNLTGRLCVRTYSKKSAILASAAAARAPPPVACTHSSARQVHRASAIAREPVLEATRVAAATLAFVVEGSRA